MFRESQSASALLLCFAAVACGTDDRSDAPFGMNWSWTEEEIQQHSEVTLEPTPDECFGSSCSLTVYMMDKDPLAFDSSGYAGVVFRKDKMVLVRWFVNELTVDEQMAIVNELSDSMNALYAQPKDKNERARVISRFDSNSTNLVEFRGALWYTNDMLIHIETGEDAGNRFEGEVPSPFEWRSSPIHSVTLSYFHKNYFSTLGSGGTDL